MGTIVYRKGRPKPWLAQIKRKGHPTISKAFELKANAERWEREQERSIEATGLPATIKELQKHTVGDIVRRYLEEKTPGKGCAVSERTVLEKFLKRDICQKSLASYASGSKEDGYKYRDGRLKETWRGRPITPRTVRREVNSIQHVFEVAREEWGYTNLANPFRKLSIKGSMHKRRERLKPGQLEKLEQACKDCRGLNRYYVPLAVYLAIETGMRLQEIFNLTWQDIDFKKRRIEIPKSKTDHVSEYKGRTIVLTVMASLFLLQLVVRLKQEGRYNQDSTPVFPMTRGAFKQSWADVCKRAGISDLTFHDLRREAGSRFHQAGLTKPEQDRMMGHANRDISMVYIDVDLKSIQDKLDRYVLSGMTVEEWTAKNKEGPPPNKELMRMVWNATMAPGGMTLEDATGCSGVCGKIKDNF
jgi:integrase